MKQNLQTKQVSEIFTTKPASGAVPQANDLYSAKVSEENQSHWGGIWALWVVFK